MPHNVQDSSSSDNPSSVRSPDVHRPFPRLPLPFISSPFSRLFLSTAEHSTALLRLRLALHLLRHLDVDFEELAHAAVQAHGLALVEFAFAVLRGNALLGAGVDEPKRDNRR